MLSSSSSGTLLWLLQELLKLQPHFIIVKQATEAAAATTCPFGLPESLQLFIFQIVSLTFWGYVLGFVCVRLFLLSHIYI